MNDYRPAETVRSMRLGVGRLPEGDGSLVVGERRRYRVKIEPGIWPSRAELVENLPRGFESLNLLVPGQATEIVVAHGERCPIAGRDPDARCTCADLDVYLVRHK